MLRSLTTKGTKVHEGRQINHRGHGEHGGKQLPRCARNNKRLGRARAPTAQFRPPLCSSVSSVVIFFPEGIRRSWPVISFGWGMLSMPRMVGEISRSEPLGFSVNFLLSSATTMNGTGLVVCAVCGPPVAGAFIISRVPRL